VDDPVLVRRFEGFGDLPRDRQRFVEWHRSTTNAIGERRPIDQLEDERAGIADALEATDLGDVRMIQGGEHVRLALKPRHAVGVGREEIGKNLDRDVAAEFSVAGFIHLPYPAGPDGRVWISYGPRRTPGVSDMKAAERRLYGRAWWLEELGHRVIQLTNLMTR